MSNSICVPFNMGGPQAIESVSMFMQRLLASAAGMRKHVNAVGVTVNLQEVRLQGGIMEAHGELTKFGFKLDSAEPRYVA